MKWLSLATVLVLAFSTSGTRADDAKDLEGTWALTSGELGEAKFPDELVKTIKLVVKDGKYAVTVGKQEDKGTCKLAPDKKPKEMDIIGSDGPNKGKTFLAIYELKGDELKICYDLGGKDRPTEFKAKANTMHFLAVYKRIKE
jgi:uncharacterized protein (TIGR03067 family)